MIISSFKLFLILKARFWVVVMVVKGGGGGVCLSRVCWGIMYPCITINVLPEWPSTGVKKFSLVLKKRNIWQVLAIIFFQQVSTFYTDYSQYYYF